VPCACVAAAGAAGARGYLRRFQLCRICFRELALAGRFRAWQVELVGRTTMTTNDPIADMLTRIRNALLVKQPFTSMPNSRLRWRSPRSCGRGLHRGLSVSAETPQAHLRIKLKYVSEQRNKRPVITGLERVSKPGRRVYTRRRICRACSAAWASRSCRRPRA
jgi:small subunit ribosomal protein S8